VTTVGDGSTNWELTRTGDCDGTPYYSKEIRTGTAVYVTDGSEVGENGVISDTLNKGALFV